MFRRSKPWLTLAFCLQLIASSLRADFAVEFHFADFTQDPQTNRLVYITPLWFINVAGTNILTPDRRRYTNDSTASLTVSNFSSTFSAGYRVEFMGKFVQMTYTNVFPTNLTGLVNSKDYVSAAIPINASTVAYSMAAADALFAPMGSGGGIATNTGSGLNNTFTNPVLKFIGPTESVVLKTNGDLFEFQADGNSTYTPLSFDFGAQTATMTDFALFVVGDAKIQANDSVSGIDNNGLFGVANRLTNGAPWLASNHLAAADGMALIKRGNNLKLETISSTGIASNSGSGLNNTFSNATFAGQTVIFSNLLVTGKSGQALGKTNTLEVQNQDGTKTFQVNTNGQPIFSVRTWLDSIGVTSLDYENRLSADSAGTSSILWSDRTLQDDVGNKAVQWDTDSNSGRTLFDEAEAISLRWHARKVFDSSEVVAMDWSNRLLKDGGGITTSLDWDNRLARDASGTTAFSWTTRRLHDAVGVFSMDWDSRITSGPWIFTGITSTSTNGISKNGVNFMLAPTNNGTIGDSIIVSGISGNTTSTKFATSTSGWLITGNTGLTSANFLGNLDAVPLRLSVAGGTAAYFDLNSSVTLGCVSNSIYQGGLYWSPYSSIAGGSNNIIQSPVDLSFLDTEGFYFIGGGRANFIKGSAGGGHAILGGIANRITDDAPDDAGVSAVGGGVRNLIHSSYAAAIPGGSDNLISNANYTVAMGLKADATNFGSFIFADSAAGVGSPFWTTNNDSFNVRARGGAFFQTLGAGLWVDGVKLSVSTATTNAAALTLGDPMIGAGNNGAATTNKSAFLRLFPNAVTNNAVLTSALVVGDGSRGVANTAVGAVSINGDGTATTFAQINSLAPANVITQSTTFRYTNTVGINSTNSALSGTTLNGPTTNKNIAVSSLAGTDSNQVETNIVTGAGLSLSGGVLSVAPKTNVILKFELNNGGAVIPTGGIQGFPVAGDAWTISGWSITAMGTSPTCTIDIWKIASGTALPTVANTIMGTKPALASGNAIISTTLTSWTTAVAKNDIWGGNVDACANATNIVVQLFGYR